VVSKALEILVGRNDEVSKKIYDKIYNSKKFDDLGDIIIQLQSFKYLLFVDKNINLLNGLL
jgi:hypothetical protein